MENIKTDGQQVIAKLHIAYTVLNLENFQLNENVLLSVCQCNYLSHTTESSTYQ